MTGVRFREGGGWEGKCDVCRQWLPLDGDFWNPTNGLRRCLDCWREYKRLKQAGRREDEIDREILRANHKVWYRLNREHALAYNRRWKAEHREHVREQQRLYRARKRAERQRLEHTRAYNAAWMRTKRSGEAA